MEFVNMTNLGSLKWEYENPQKFEAYWFEKVNGNALRLWAKTHLSFVGIICAVYFLFVWLGPRWMKNRKPYSLEKPLAAWNFFLSLFSLAVVIRMSPEVLRILAQPNGWYKSICIITEGLHYSTTYWAFLYIVSKIVELGDTVFIVLRKKPLILLHWFHHFNMVWSSFFLFIEGEPSTIRYVVLVNSFVHTLMYFYYGLRALQIKVPKKISMTITTCQIMQFVVGLLGQYQQLFYFERNGKPCTRTHISIVITTIFGFSYLFLFSHLFYKSYLAKPKVKTA